MLTGLLRALAVGASLVLVASFGLFARDQIEVGSQEQQTALAEGAPTARAPAPRHEPAKQPRRAIDGIARALTSPFASLATAPTSWGERTVPTLAALLVYGFGFGMLARTLALSGSRRPPASRT